MKTGTGSRNPGGRPKYSGEWAAAVRKVLHEVVDLPGGGRAKRLHRLAERLVSAAEGGDLGAIREIGNRLDGKPTQAVVGAGEDGAHLFRGVVDLRE